MVADSAASSREDRRAPGVVIVAAIALGLFGAGMGLGSLSPGGTAEGLALGAAALILCASAVILVTADRMGYWIGLVVAVLLALVMTWPIAAHPHEVAPYVVFPVSCTPVVLLLLPAARRPGPRTAQQRTPGSRTASGLPVPEAWSRPGWSLFVLMALGSFGALGSGLVLLPQDDARPGGLFLGTLGMAFAATLPLLWPGVPRATPEAATVTVRGSPQHGVAFGYSVIRTSAGVVGLACFALCLGVLSWYAPIIAGGGPGALLLRVLAGAVALAGAVFAVVGARRRFGRRSRIVLTDSCVVHQRGSSIAGAPWEAIADLGVLTINQQTLITLRVDRDAVLREGPGSIVDRIAGSASPNTGDFPIPIRGMSTDPLILYHVIGYYLTHATARPELAGGPGLDRIRQADRLKVEPAHAPQE